MRPSAPTTHGVRFAETAFFVIHRRREYGPFDYEWAVDLGSLDLTYRGSKYGEFMSPAQMCIDLSEFRLPQRVVQVAMIVTGCVLSAIRSGHGVKLRNRRILSLLRAAGCARFAEGFSA